MIAAFISVAVIGACSGLAEAANVKKKKRYYRPHPYQAERVKPDEDPTGYYERLLNAVPFGSKRWWQIYEDQMGSGRR